MATIVVVRAMGEIDLSMAVDARLRACLGGHETMGLPRWWVLFAASGTKTARRASQAPGGRGAPGDERCDVVFV